MPPELVRVSKAIAAQWVSIEGIYHDDRQAAKDLWPQTKELVEAWAALLEALYPEMWAEAKAARTKATDG